MPNPQNIAGQGFHTNPERIGKGRPKGARNRTTIIREWLESNGDSGMVVDDMVLAAIKKAKTGDVGAFMALMDGAYGKVVDKSETTFKEVSSSSEDVAKRYVERTKGK